MHRPTPLSQVGVSHPPASIPEAIFREYIARVKSGNPDVGISEDDYYVMTSAWVADNTFKYAPTHYPPMPQSVSSYVIGRRRGGQAVDEQMGVLLGEWARTVHIALGDNAANHSLLIWAMEKCESKGLSDKAAKLMRAAEQYIRTPHPSDLDDALRVMEIDARDRRRGPS